jgi:hypothetical protein
MLTFAYQWSFLTHLQHWAEWASSTVATWDDPSRRQRIDWSVFEQALNKTTD